MATANVETIYAPIPPPTTTVALTLSTEEARALRRLLGRVSGPEDGPRGQLAAIADALTRAGVSPIPGLLVTGTVHFEKEDRDEVTFLPRRPYGSTRRTGALPF